MKTLIEIMARSVGARPQQNKNCDVEYLMDVEALERLVELARADEREACAQLCENKGLVWKAREDINPEVAEKAYMASTFIAAAIRNMSNK